MTTGADRAAAPGRGGGVVVLNNSRETFTPTVSGAIATCIWEMVRLEGPRRARPVVLTRPADAEPYPYPAVRFLDPAASRWLRGRPERAVRRVTGWAHAEQRAYAHAALADLNALRPDAVICNNDPEIAAFLSRRLPGTRVVHWFHNLEIASDPVRRAFTRDRRIRSVAVSAYLARAVEQVYRMTPLSVAVARNGVDGERFRPAGNAPGDSSAVPVVAFLGRVAVEKGTDTFLQAMALLAERTVPFEVLVIGETNWGFSDGGPYAEKIRAATARVESLGVTVRRTGHVVRADVPRVLAGADVQVLSSRWDEPCALTVLEGMASGLAMVATATGGTPELAGRAGLLVPREDPIAMADAVARLVQDPVLRAGLAREARARAETFTWARTWAGLEAAALDESWVP